MAEAKVLACYVVGYVLFWLPARIAARRLTRGGHAGPEAVDLCTLLVAAGVGYLTFWVFLAHRVVGLVWAGLVLMAAVASLWNWRRRGARWGDLWSRPARFAFWLGLLYLALVTLFGGLGRVRADFPGSYLDPPSLTFWFTSRAGDDLIPLKFASALANGSPLRGVATNFFGWQYSDRPPLQTGVLLAFWPLTFVVGPAAVGLALGTVLQVQWVVGLAAMAAALGLSRRRATFVLLATAATGSIYFNTVYVWPKLFAAALFSAAAAVLARAWRERRALEPSETALAAMAATFALLAHGTIAFSLLALAAMASGYRPFRQWRTWSGAGLLAVAVYLPWLGYQRFVDPPGDRCLKWMFAGCVPADDVPFLQSLRASYGQLTPGQWLADRRAGLGKLLGDPSYDHDTAACARAIWARWRGAPAAAPAFRMPWCHEGGTLACNLRTLAALIRYDQVDHLLRALGVLNLGWPIVGWIFVRRSAAGRSRRAIGMLLLFAVLNLGIWAVLILLPEMFTIRSGSYALLLSLIAIVGLAIAAAPRPLGWGLFGLHLLVSGVLWVVLVPHPCARNWGLAIRPHVVPVLVAAFALWQVVRDCRLHAIAYRSRRPEKALAKMPSRPGWIFAAVVLVVGMSAVAIKSPLAAMSRWECAAPGGVLVRPTGAELNNAGMLFDGVRHDPANFASWEADRPLELRFRSPQSLAEIRLHLCDALNRRYAFHVEGLIAGRWNTLYDCRSEPAKGIIKVSAPAEALDAIRITGSCPNDPNVPDRAMQLEELELIPRLRP